MTASRDAIRVIVTLQGPSMERAMYTQGNVIADLESRDNDAISANQITTTFRWMVASHATATQVDQLTSSVTL